MQDQEPGKKGAQDSAGREEAVPVRDHLTGQGWAPKASLELGKLAVVENLGFFCLWTLAALPATGWVWVTATFPYSPLGAGEMAAILAAVAAHLAAVERVQRFLQDLPRRTLDEVCADWVLRLPTLLGVAGLVALLSAAAAPALRFVASANLSSVGMIDSALRGLSLLLLADLYLRLVGFAPHEVLLETRNPLEVLAGSFRTGGIPGGLLLVAGLHNAVVSMVLIGLWMVGGFTAAVLGNLGPLGALGSVLLIPFGLAMGCLLAWLHASWAAYHLIRKGGRR